MLALVNQNGYLKRYPLSLWQPVKIPQNGHIFTYDLAHGFSAELVFTVTTVHIVVNCFVCDRVVKSVFQYYIRQ